jgi:hypothetical protein
VTIAALSSLAALSGTRERHAEVADYLGGGQRNTSETSGGREFLLDLLHTSQRGAALSYLVIAWDVHTRIKRSHDSLYRHL